MPLPVDPKVEQFILDARALNFIIIAARLGIPKSYLGVSNTIGNIRAISSLDLEGSPSLLIETPALED